MQAVGQDCRQWLRGREEFESSNIYGMGLLGTCFWVIILIDILCFREMHTVFRCLVAALLAAFVAMHCNSALAEADSLASRIHPAMRTEAEAWLSSSMHDARADDISPKSYRPWSLEECIAHAKKHNVELKSEELNIKDKDISVSESKWAYVPSFSASSSYNLSIGRVLDETTYDFVTNETVSGANSSISGSVLLFNGMRNLRMLQYSKLDRQAAVLQYEAAAEELELGVTAYFLEVLCAKENIRNREAIVESLEAQQSVTSKKADAGKATMADLLQINSRLADARNELLTAVQSYDMSRLNLCQLLEIEDYGLFEPYMPEIDSLEYTVFDPADAYSGAGRTPALLLAEKNLELAEKNMQVARSSYYPSLSLGAGYGTSFSNVRQKAVRNDDGTYRYEDYPFLEQYADNASAYISLGLSIPILNNLSIRNNVRHAEVAKKQAEYALESAKKQVFKEVAQALIDVEAAWGKYSGACEYLASASEAARQITLKYESGAADVVEYGTAISSLVEAQVQHLTYKYEYVFKLRVLEFYIRHAE